MVYVEEGGEEEEKEEVTCSMKRILMCSSSSGAHFSATSCAPTRAFTSCVIISHVHFTAPHRNSTLPFPSHPPFPPTHTPSHYSRKRTGCITVSMNTESAIAVPPALDRSTTPLADASTSYANAVDSLLPLSASLNCRR